MWLKQANITNYTINDDLSIDVSSDIIIQRSQMSGFTNLPVKFRTVYGSFHMENLPLTTLKGCPDEVDGVFNISRSKITNLEGSPKLVRSKFVIDNTRTLVSTKGMTPTIHGSVDLSYNSALTSLEGFATTCDSVSLTGCRLTSLKGLPNRINGALIVTDCARLTSLEGAPRVVEEFMHLSGCKDLKSLQHLPDFANSPGTVYLGDESRLIKDAYTLFMCKGLMLVRTNASGAHNFGKVRAIVNSHLSKPYGMKRWIECQSELIDKGFTLYAKVPE
jgi:hypothetical protein